MMGIVPGIVVHTIAAAFGLSAVIATSTRAFMIVKFAGAAYWADLGIQLMLARSSDVGTAKTFTHAPPWAIYRAGVLTNLLNPKVTLFFLAFLPQFVSPTAPGRQASK